MKPSARHWSANASSSGACSSIVSDTVSQPSRSEISGAPGPPHSEVSRHHTRRATCSSSARLTRSATGPCISGGHLRPDRRRPAGDDRGTALVDPFEQPSERVGELLDAVDQQLVGDLGHVDPGLRERGQIWTWILLRGRASHLAVVSDRQQRLQRHRVHRVRSHKLLDVHRVRIARVLRAGRGPQRALEGGAGVPQRLPARPAEYLPEPPVGEARIGDRRLALQVRAAELGEPAVDVRVDPRDEERCDRVDIQWQAIGQPAFQGADVRLGHGLVCRHREQQRDVDVDPLVERLLDRRHALRRARDLDHRVRTLQPLPVGAHLCDVPSVSCARAGETSSETNPSRPPDARCTSLSTSAASCTSRTASRS